MLSPLADGTYASGWLVVHGSTATSFNWRLTSTGNSAVNMAVVIVEGGGQSAIHTYDDWENGVHNGSGNGLTAPGGAPITRVEFCFDDKALRDLITTSVGGGSG
ncbi:MAG: hypothetical protein FJW96_12480, partial [Actinobacteria bacterium]|nr:hypothetical protein [Actinomycetota bacterium]